MMNSEIHFYSFIYLLLFLFSIQRLLGQDTIYVFRNINTYNDYIDYLYNNEYQLISSDSSLKICKNEKISLLCTDTGIYNIIAIKNSEPIALKIISLSIPDIKIEFSPIEYNRKKGWQIVDSLIIIGLPEYKIVQFRMEYFIDFIYYNCDSLELEFIRCFDLINISNKINETNKILMKNIVRNGKIVFSNIYIRFHNSYFILKKNITLYTPII